MRNKAVKLLEDIEANKLPSLPHVLVKLLQACRDENIGFDSLSEIIGQDASLTTKVIKAANSPVYGRARHLNSLKHTLMFLGFDTIKSIAITASIKQFFSAYSNQKTQFLKSFWHHSLTCATISRSLAELTSYPYPEEAYTSGLLHDIGKLMIEPRLQDEYSQIEHNIYPADAALKLEQEAVGIQHPELAAIMLEKWNMPDVICDAIRYHHAATEEIKQAHLLAKIIHYSSLLSSNVNADHQSDIIDTGIRLFDLSEAIINDLVSQAKDDAQSVATSMDIDIGDSDPQNDELKQIQLAQEVRDTALAQNSAQAINIDSNDFFKSIQQSINLLFGIKNSLFLSLNESQQVLSTHKNQPKPDTCLFDELNIEIDSSCIVARCITNKNITHCFSNNEDNKVSIIDEQLSHGFKTDGFICLPIIYKQQALGVFLLACNETQALKLLKDNALLNIFATNITDKIQQHTDFNNKSSELTHKNSELFLERARKIIHETNNPLTVIRNYLQLLSLKIDDTDPAQSDLKTIRDEIDRISNIIVRCKEQPESHDSNVSEININTILNELIDIYKSSLFASHNITSTLNLDKNLKATQLDKDAIKQIITNLLKNSVEAMKSSGNIIITTGKININGRNFIELKIEDNGPGIPTNIMNNIYSPVSSTKGTDHSGLGLSITKNLVNRTGGSISCSTNNNGTIFSVQFPEIK